MGKFAKIFQHVPDPRADNARHELLGVLSIALAAVLCGAESCSDMADFGQSKEELRRLVLGLEHGIPSHDTFSRVFRLLEPEAFERAFRRFMAACAKANKLKLSGVVAIDGKALRGAYERGGKTSPLHLVNVFAVDARMALAQRKAPGRDETAGALEALELLDLEGSIVTADALHCRRGFAATVLEQRRRLRPGDQGQLPSFVQSRHTAIYTIGKAQQRQTDRTIGARSKQGPRRNGDPQYQAGRTPPLSRYRSCRADHIAQASARAACRYASRPLLCPIEIHVAEETSACHSESLGHREPAALGARCSFLRGSQSSAKGPCARESCPPAKARPQHPASASNSGLDTPQNQARWLGQRLPFAGNQPYAIALRS
jgi:DDE_Tnp_1-associated